MKSENPAIQARVFAADDLRDLGVRLFVACGSPAEEARIVADELVEASLMGLDSHGVIRYPQYVDDALAGRVRPGAPLRILAETGSTAVVDCGFNFGPVTAARMAAIVSDKASHSHVACAVSRNSHHVSRLGSYVQKIAARGLFGFAAANSSRHGHWVVPWGGREGRLATNPLAFAAPGIERPILLDMSTSMIAEGRIRALRDQGRPLPPNSVLDATGRPTADPDAFYGPPRGTIRPFGSELGYKGFGLGLLVEILGGILSGSASSEDLPYINGLFLMAVDPEPFCGVARFRELIADLGAYVTGSPPAPGFDEVVMPGTLDFRTREKRLAQGVPVPLETWRCIVDACARVGVRADGMPGSAGAGAP